MTIAAFDHLDPEEKKVLLRQCCGSRAWIDKMIQLPPAEDLIDLFEDAEEAWYECNEDDWKEAFLHHPKIGDVDALRQKFSSDQFAENEQGSIKQASEKSLQLLAEGNKVYEILEILNNRLRNTPEDEIKIAMDEQNKITKLRLEKLFEI
jgi:2-oxo-4-hydroxy-4-carboxy-5-ureidoimidazoline decarboxylase